MKPGELGKNIYFCVTELLYPPHKFFDCICEHSSFAKVYVLITYVNDLQKRSNDGNEMVQYIHDHMNSPEAAEHPCHRVDQDERY